MNKKGKHPIQGPGRRRREDVHVTRSDLLSLLWTMEHDEILNAPHEKIETLRKLVDAGSESPASPGNRGQGRAYSNS